MPKLLTDNFYQSPKLGSKRVAKQREQERIEEVQKVVTVAKACLGTEVFATYKRQYEKLEQKTINSMILYTKNYFKSGKADPMSYAMVMSRYITQLDTFRALIDDVEEQGKWDGLPED